MKRQGYMLRTLILSMFVATALGMARGQIGGDVLKVRVPFNFSAGTQAFLAGKYSLRPQLPNTMLLRNSDRPCGCERNGE